jgi:hypothetical protein
MAGGDAAMTRWGSRRAGWVVARSGNALETRDRAEGHRNDQNFFTPPDLCAPSDRGVLRLTRVVPVFSSA